MKSPDQAAFKTIVIITMVIAVAMLPFVAKADSHMKHNPPAFSEFDANGDGAVSEEEFNAFRGARMEAMAAAGKPMKGAKYAPAFSDLDTDGDGVCNANDIWFLRLRLNLSRFCFINLNIKLKRCPLILLTFN